MIISRKSRETKQLIMAHSPYVTRLASRLEKILCAKTDKKLGSRIEKDKKGTIIRETNEERIAPMHEGRWFSWKERGRTLRCVCVCGGRVGDTDMLSFCSHFAVISHTWIDNSLVDEVCTQKGRHFLKSVTWLWEIYKYKICNVYL